MECLVNTQSHLPTGLLLRRHAQHNTGVPVAGFVTALHNRRRYIANSYRVLLTRARQGMVIFVPHGDDQDQTRPCNVYDEIYGHLRQCGLPELAI